MTETEGGGQYDLEERPYEFARCVRGFVKKLLRTMCNLEDVKQVVRASGSVGAKRAGGPFLFLKSRIVTK